VKSSHTWWHDAAVFDDENLVSCAGLVPVMELAQQTGLPNLIEEHVAFRCERIRSGAAHPTPKLTSIIAGMAAGADSIDDLDVIRAGGMTKLFDGVYAPATMGIFLREFTHGHTRQLASVLRRHLVALATRTDALDGMADQAFVDIDSLLRPVYRHAKQGASFGHTKIANKQVLRKGLSPLATTISTRQAAPLLAGIRLRAGKAGSGKGAASMVTKAITTAKSLGAENILCRGDSAFGNGKVIAAVVNAGARFSFVLTKSRPVLRAIGAIVEDAWIRCVTPVRSSIPTPKSGSPTPRSPTSSTPRSPAHRMRSPLGWSCGGYATATTPASCSRCGGITRFSPPTLNRSPTRTSPTASTRSSNRCSRT
jgi:hypothetical protein